LPRASKPQPDIDLVALLPSWELALRAERKSPATIKSYGDGVRRFLDWCAAQDRPATLDRATLSGFTASLLDEGAEASTARSRHLAVRRYSAWLADEQEIPDDLLIGVRSPKLDEKVIEPLTDAELGKLIKACQGTDMRDRRDEALIRLMAETGARAGETAALLLADVDLSAGTAIIRRGKGGRGRVTPFGPQTARSIDRYLRLRRTHRLAATPALWLGDRGKAFGYDALHKSLTMRAAMADVAGFHPHKLRHTAAHRWLAAGGSEGGLMAVAGWTRPDMLLRYTKAQASARAADEARRLNLGDFA
jgi:integrase/recombinase XerD